jgi:hypothetical protein
MSDINITVDPSAALTYLQRLSTQAPFATSLALNRVANIAQQDIRTEIPKHFTLRRPQFVLQTIKIDKADRSTKSKLEVTIRVDPNRDFLAKFEAGGTKRPRDGHSIAIPTSNVRRGKTDVVQKSQRPRALLASKSAGKGRILKTPKAIIRLLGSAKSRVRQVLYVLLPVVRIRPMLGFVKTANASVQRSWVHEMTQAFTDAERTARR